MTDVVSTGIAARPEGSIRAARLRLGLFLSIAAVMIAGPVAEQVFGLRTAAVRSWTMFSAIGLGIIDVSFAARQPDGTLTPIDRFDLLAARRDRKLKRIEDREELDWIIDRLCSALGPDADLRVTARQATRSGWQTIRTDEQNACPG